jgi:hypothetical protein
MVILINLVGVHSTPKFNKIDIKGNLFCSREVINTSDTVFYHII